MATPTRRQRQIIRTWQVLTIIQGRPSTAAEISGELETIRRSFVFLLDGIALTLGVRLIDSHERFEFPVLTL